MQGSCQPTTTLGWRVPIHSTCFHLDRHSGLPGVEGSPTVSERFLDYLPSSPPAAVQGVSGWHENTSVRELAYGGVVRAGKGQATTRGREPKSARLAHGIGRAKMSHMQGRDCIICGEQFDNLPLLRIPEHPQQGAPAGTRLICSGSNTLGRPVRRVDDRP